MGQQVFFQDARHEGQNAQPQQLKLRHQRYAIQINASSLSWERGPNRLKCYNLRRQRLEMLLHCVQIAGLMTGGRDT